MSINLRVCLVLLCLSFSPSIIAVVQDRQDGNELLKSCSAFIETERCIVSGNWVCEADAAIKATTGIRCGGIMQGLQTMNILYQFALEDKTFFCLSREGMQSTQLARVVVKWLEDRPEILHMDMNGLAVAALIDAFPCEQPLPIPAN